MQLAQNPVSHRRVYSAGLDRIQEGVVSSHFMHELAGNAELDVYDEEEFAARRLDIDARTVYDSLIPDLLNACRAFCGDRAAATKPRARENYRKYGLRDPGEVGTAEFITEVLFDRQFLRGPRERCSREQVCRKVAERVSAGAPIELVLPALPFKFSSPLKTRGRLPDLAEVNFLLGLYEIVTTIELIYRESRPGPGARLAGFTVVSDGNRFNRLTNEPDSVVELYRNRLDLLIHRLGLGRHITLLDYRSLLRDRLPEPARAQKSTIAIRARAAYENTLWPIFDPCAMTATMKAAAAVEPDPESANPDGRFVALLKSLVYTINYRTLERLPADQFRALYRELTAHIFEPYAVLSPAEFREVRTELAAGPVQHTERVKEGLRQSMLREAWTSAIGYLAEIKSDRELPEDPILTCLPDHIRWTIHAKAGQLAVLTPTVGGAPVQSWAGTAVFRSSGKNRIKLGTLPVLALEGVGAVPVSVIGDDVLPCASQPLFYIHPDVAFADLDDFLARVKTSLVRKRTN